jgi:hypothetical protein
MVCVVDSVVVYIRRCRIHDLCLAAMVVHVAGDAATQSTGYVPCLAAMMVHVAGDPATQSTGCVLLSVLLPDEVQVPLLCLPL